MGCSTVLEHVVALALTFGVAASGQSVSSKDDRLESMEALGSVGPYRIGLNYTVRHHTELVSAHYFYVTQLKDIPLTGSVRGDAVELKGADGSTFRLHFIGNGSNEKSSLTFYNSIGLSGSWVLERRTLPVNLEIRHSTENPGERLYTQVTDQPDSDYGAMVARVRLAILDGNESELAKYTEFPLRVNGTHHSLIIRNATELKANWSRIFTPEFVSKLRKDVPHEMFVHEGEVMLGDGELWFGDKGLISLNPLIGQQDLVKSR